MIKDKPESLGLAKSLEWLTQKREIIDKEESGFHMIYLIWHNQMQERLDALERIELIEKTLLPTTEGSSLYTEYEEERKKLLLGVCKPPEYNNVPYTREMLKRRELLLGRLRRYMEKHRKVSA